MNESVGLIPAGHAISRGPDEPSVAVHFEPLIVTTQRVSLGGCGAGGAGREAPLEQHLGSHSDCPTDRGPITHPGVKESQGDAGSGVSRKQIWFSCPALFSSRCTQEAL